MVLEVAVTAGVEVIVTHNTRDFEGADQYGKVSPGWFVTNSGDPK